MNALLTWLFSLLLRRRDKAGLLGDLIEEQALRASSMPPHDVSRWYREQLRRSIVPVMWANIRRGSSSYQFWLKTLGAAFMGALAGGFLTYAGVALEVRFISSFDQHISTINGHLGQPAQDALRRMLSMQFLGQSGLGHLVNLISLTIAFSSMVLACYVAACIRRGAAVAIALISMVQAIASLVQNGPRQPMWLQLTLIGLWPVAALAGLRLRDRKRFEAGLKLTGSSRTDGAA